MGLSTSLAEPATRLLYTFAGRALLVETLDDLAGSATKALFSNWLFDPIESPSSYSEPDTSLRIQSGQFPFGFPSQLTSFDVPNGGVCTTDGERFYFDLLGSAVVVRNHDPFAEVWLNEPQNLNSESRAQIISYALSASLRRCGLFEIHSAGVVAPDGTTAMIVGPSGSGKSTLTLQLVRAGWRYLSDDVLFVTESEGKIEAYGVRRLFALTSKSIEAIGLSGPLLGLTHSHEKTFLDPQDYFPNALVKISRPQVLFFISLNGKPGSNIECLTQSEVMSRLMKFCPWACYDKPVARAHLGALAALARQCRSYDLSAGADLLSDPQHASMLLTAHMHTK